MIKKTYLFHLPWPFRVLVETQVYTGCQSFFTHCCLSSALHLSIKKTYLLHLPWPFRVLDETQTKKKMPRNTVFLSPAPPCPSVWKPTRVGLENLGWDPHSSPTSSQAGLCPPLFILWRKQKKTRKWIFYQLTQLCSERKSWSHSRLRLWHYNPARPSPPKEGNSAYGEIYLRKLSPLFRGPNTPRQPMNYSLNATFSKHRAGERSMVVNHGGWA